MAIRILRDLYIYSVSFSAIAAAASDTQSFNIEADADFEVLKQTYFADISGGVQTDSSRVIPDCSVRILTTGSGRELQNEAVKIPSIFGTGVFPFILPQPKIFPARSTIQITMTNDSAATTYDIQLSFIGVKLFKTRQ